MTNTRKKVVAVLSDLMFTVKIQEAAKRAGLECVFVKTPEDALAQARLDPAVMIIDLNGGFGPLELIERLKGDPATKQVELLGYVSHVQADVKQAALEKGCDRVVARSAFVQGLAAVMGRYGNEP